MNIGEASKRTGLPIKTIRYYEEIGLLIADRRTNGYRDYSNDHIHRLAFLKRAREFDFSLDDCRELLGLYSNQERASSQVKTLAAHRLEDLKLKAAEITHLAATLEQLVKNCAGDDQPDCPIIEELAHEKPKSVSTKHKCLPTDRTISDKD